MPPEAVEMQHPYARKTRFVTVKHLDQRTVAARRAAALAKEFTAMLGHAPSVGELMAIDRAAALAAVAEDAGRAAWQVTRV